MIDIKEFQTLSDSQKRQTLEQAKDQRKEAEKRILGILSGDTRSSVNFAFGQLEQLDAHVYDSPEDQAGKSAAHKYLNELMNLYNSGNPTMERLADNGQLGGFFDDLLKMNLYFTAQNNLNSTSYPTDFRSFMDWRNEQMEF